MLLPRWVFGVGLVVGVAFVVSLTRGGQLLLSHSPVLRLLRQHAFVGERSLARTASACWGAQRAPLPPFHVCVNGSRRSFFRAIEHIHTMQAPPPWDLEDGIVTDKRKMESIYPTTGGLYPVLAIADAFLQCSRGTPAVYTTGRTYRRTELNHSEVELWAEDPVTGAREQLIVGPWAIGSQYESSAFGIYTGALVTAACASQRGGAAAAHSLRNVSGSIANSDSDAGTQPALVITASYRGATSTFPLHHNPEPPRTNIAMVGCFAIDRYLLRLWLDYYVALGVETFYLYPNTVKGVHPNPVDEEPSEEQVRDVEAIAAGVAAHVVIVRWNILHWIQTDTNDITHGQPMAINNALQRWRHLHEWMLFYDLDEFFVAPRYDSLASFFSAHAAATGPIFALRTPCAWARFDLNESLPDGPNIRDMQLQDFVTRRVIRHIKPGGREKYALNVTAGDAHGLVFINIHGPYSHMKMPCEYSACAENLVSGEGPTADGPYHLHLLNRADSWRNADSREVFLLPEKQQDDTRIADYVRRAILAHQARERAAYTSV